jgi:hypothetical protein
MASRLFTIVVVALWTIGIVNAQEKPKPTYDTILEQVKKSDPKADFLKLRMAFTETAQYSPYGEDTKTRDAMNEAMEQKEYEKAAELAQKILKSKYVDLNAHLVAQRAYTELKKDDQAKYHKYVYDGLLQSILKSGDGKATASAYVVIATDEEYAVLAALGIRPNRQALLSEKGEKFDQMVGIESKSKERVILYFNVSKPFTWLGEQLKKDK